MSRHDLNEAYYLSEFKKLIDEIWKLNKENLTLSLQVIDLTVQLKTQKELSVALREAEKRFL